MFIDGLTHQSLEINDLFSVSPQDDWMKILVLPLLSTKQCNYGIHADQSSSNLTKLIANSISIYVF